MKKKVLFVVLVVTMLLSTTASASPWWFSRCQVVFDNELGIMGDVTLRFASDGGSFIRPITKGVVRASALKVMSLLNMVTPSSDGSPIPEQSKIW